MDEAFLENADRGNIRQSLGQCLGRLDEALGLVCEEVERTEPFVS